MPWGIYDKDGNRIGTLKKDSPNPIGCLVAISALWITGLVFHAFSVLFPESERLTNNSKITYDSIGPVKIGMTVKEAEKAGKIKLVPVEDEKIKTRGCSYVKPLFWLHGIKFMLANGRIARIDVENQVYTKTVEDVGINFPTSLLESQYGKSARVTIDKVNAKKYVELIPQKAENYRIIFEANYVAVDKYRAGKLPEVKYKNGCN